jgi:hypothetical protein
MIQSFEAHRAADRRLVILTLLSHATGYSDNEYLIHAVLPEQGHDISRDKLHVELAWLLPEMLRTVAFQTLSTMGEADKPAKAMDVMLLAKALRDIAGTQKTNIDTELQLRKLRAETKAKADAAAAAVEQMTRQAGMSEELVTTIRARILGVGEQA